MNKHPDCDSMECGCILKEHKGYDTCQRQGMCNQLALKGKDCGGPDDHCMLEEARGTHCRCQDVCAYV